jgi:hypothetical protein
MIMFDIDVEIKYETRGAELLELKKTSTWLSKSYSARYSGPEDVDLFDFQRADELERRPLDGYQVEGDQEKQLIKERELVSAGQEQLLEVDVEVQPSVRSLPAFGFVAESREDRVDQAAREVEQVDEGHCGHEELLHGFGLILEREAA